MVIKWRARLTENFPINLKNYVQLSGNGCLFINKAMFASPIYFAAYSDRFPYKVLLTFFDMAVDFLKLH